MFVAFETKEVFDTENNGILLLLILLLVFTTTGNGITGGESWILILLALGLWSIPTLTGGVGCRTGCGCANLQ